METDLKVILLMELINWRYLKFHLLAQRECKILDGERTYIFLLHIENSLYYISLVV